MNSTIRKHYSLLVAIFVLSFNNAFCQPEIYYNEAFHGSQISSKYLDYLRQGEVIKIIEKCGIWKTVIEFDTSRNQIVLTEKVFNIKNWSVEFLFTNDYRPKSIKSSGNTFFKYNSDLSYEKKKDAIFAYNVAQGDSLLIAKIFSMDDNSTLVHQYVLGPDGKMNQYYTIRSEYDSSQKLIKQSVNDTTNFNNRTITFTGEYNMHGDIVKETVNSRYHSNKPKEVIAEYSYVYNKDGFWRKKSSARNSGKKELIAKRRYWYY